MDTVSLEAHTLARRSEQYCHSCASWRGTERDIALVNSATLEVLGNYTLSACVCGADDLTR